MKPIFFYVFAAVALSGCTTTELPYAYDGASNYEHFSVPIVIQYSRTEMVAKQIPEFGRRIVFKTPIAFRDTRESDRAASIMTSRNEPMGEIQAHQKFVGVDATLTTVDWVAVLFSMGLADMTKDLDSERVYCTRLSLESVESSDENALSTRLACFRDSDDDGLMDEALAPVWNTHRNSGFLPSSHIKRVLTSFTPFELTPSQDGMLADQLTLLGITDRNQTSTWMGKKADKYYTFQGMLSPDPKGATSASWQMTSPLPVKGTVFVDKVEWFGGLVAMSRETEDQPWSISVTMPEQDAEANLSLNFDLGR